MNEYNNPALKTLARNLRRNMTEEERRLWYDFLRLLPVTFYRQKVIGPYIVDFYCAKAKLVVEIDGAQHFEEEGKRGTVFTVRSRPTCINVVSCGFSGRHAGTVGLVVNFKNGKIRTCEPVLRQIRLARKIALSLREISYARPAAGSKASQIHGRFRTVQSGRNIKGGGRTVGSTGGDLTGAARKR